MFHVLLSLLLLFSTSFVDSFYLSSNLSIPVGIHPRLFINGSEGVDKLIEKLSLPQFEPILNEAASSGLAHSTLALFSLLGGNRTSCDAAVVSLLSTLEGSCDHPNSYCLLDAALVYDWCWQWISEAHKTSLREIFFRIVALPPRPGYPPQFFQPDFLARGEGWIESGMLFCGLAIYDEDPSLWNIAIDAYESGIRQPRLYALSGGAHNQGNAYGPSRLVLQDALMSIFFKSFTGEFIFSEIIDSFKEIPYSFIQSARPDFQQFRRGDTFDPEGRHHQKYTMYLLFSALFDDRSLLALSQYPIWFNLPPIALLFSLLYLPPSFNETTTEEIYANLETSHFYPSPSGLLITRSHWDPLAPFNPLSNTTVVHMNMSPFYVENHQHKDAGTFEIYHRGSLTAGSGTYYASDGAGYGEDHWKNYYQQSISHNALLVRSPGLSTMPGPYTYSADTVDDGGQTWKQSRSNLLFLHDQEVGVPTAQHSSDTFDYLSADISYAYNHSHVEVITRSFVAAHNSDGTAHFVAFDRVTSTDPSSERVFLLHSLTEPHLPSSPSSCSLDSSFRCFALSNTLPVHLSPTLNYDGGLIGTTLLPANAAVEAVGGAGREFLVNGVNYLPDSGIPSEKYEAGAWRLEITDEGDSASTLFLHLLTSSTASEAIDSLSSTSSREHVRLISSLTTVGIQFGSQSTLRAVLFANNTSGEPVDSMSFLLPGSSNDSLDVLVCDLLPNSYRVDINSLTGTDNNEKRTLHGNVTVARGIRESKFVFWKNVPVAELKGDHGPASSGCLELKSVPSGQWSVSVFNSSKIEETTFSSSSSASSSSSSSSILSSFQSIVFESISPSSTSSSFISEGGSSNDSSVYIVIGVISSFLVVIGALLLVFFLKRKRGLSASDSGRELSSRR